LQAGEDACGPRRARPLVREASLKGIVEFYSCGKIY